MSPLLPGAVVLLAVTGLAIGTLAFRRCAAAAIETDARAATIARGPRVKIAVTDASPSVRHLALLGEARPFASVTLYAKVSGYLRDVRVDRGDHVGAGQLLATIESPETDRAYAGARVDYENKAQFAQRVAQLRAKNFVSAQEAEQAQADAGIAKERLGALEEQRAYQQLRAPFAGTITARYADPGALMQSATTSETSALPVVTISQTNRLRVTVYLDQVDAIAVRTGARVTISLDERPDVQIPARIARVSGELDAKSRKMMAEVDLDNANGAIVPGGFVRVVLDVPQPSLPQAPSESLIIRKTGTFVGVVGSDGMARLRAVRIAVNDGEHVTFASGVQAGDRLALNLGAGTGDSLRVEGVR